MARTDLGFEIDQKEWEQTIAMIKDLPAKVGQNAFAKSCRDGTKTILQVMQANIDATAENPTGLLSDSLKVRRKKKYEPYFWHSAVSVYVGKKRGDGAYYWHMVEHGHRLFSHGKDTGKRAQKMEFAISAVEATKGPVLSDFGRRAKAEIFKQWKKRPGG